MVKTASNKTKSYIDFNNHSLNQEVVLSIEESGRTVESIKRAEKIGHIVSMVLVYAFILALAIVVIFPFYWMLITSLKQKDDLLNKGRKDVE